MKGTDRTNPILPRVLERLYRGWDGGPRIASGVREGRGARAGGPRTRSGVTPCRTTRSGLSASVLAGLAVLAAGIGDSVERDGGGLALVGAADVAERHDPDQRFAF